MDGMTAKEISRLIDWLKSKEVSDADIIDCIQKLAKKNRLPRADQSGGSLKHKPGGGTRPATQAASILSQTAG